MYYDLKTVIRKFCIFLLSCFYTACCLLTILYITSIDIKRFGRIPESSLTEGVQESLLLLSVLIFTYKLFQDKAHGLWLISGFLFCMLIREWDGIFDNIFHGAWKFIAIPAALLCIWLALRNGITRAAKELADFMNTKSYWLLCLGLIIVLVFSRIIGMRSVVQLLSGTHFHESIKNLLEEGHELLGYMIIFTSAVYYLLEKRKSQK